ATFSPSDVDHLHLHSFPTRRSSDLSDVEIVAISNSTYESAEKFCQENVPNAVPIANWPDLVALPDIDIVWIGTPPYMHSAVTVRSEEHTSELQSLRHLVCRLLLDKK